MSGERPGPRTRAHKSVLAYRDLLARVAHNLKRLRHARNWSQEQAAARCKTAPRVIQEIEAQRTNFTAVTLARLGDGFEVDPRQLLRPISDRANKASKG